LALLARVSGASHLNLCVTCLPASSAHASTQQPSEASSVIWWGLVAISSHLRTKTLPHTCALMLLWWLCIQLLLITMPFRMACADHLPLSQRTEMPTVVIMVLLVSDFVDVAFDFVDGW
jgi:hypothetical protein